MNRGLILFSCILIFSSLAIAESPEDYVTEKPQTSLTLDEPEVSSHDEFTSISEGTELYDLDTIGDSEVIELTGGFTWGYQTGWEKAPDELLQGDLEVSASGGNPLSVDVLTYTDSNMDEIDQRYIAKQVLTSSSTETYEVQWDREDLIEDSSFDLSEISTNAQGDVYMGVQVRKPTADDDLFVERIDFNTEPSEDTYEYLAEDVPFQWTLPDEVSDRDNVDFNPSYEIVEGGTEGDYHLDVYTNGVTGMEYEFDEPLSGINRSYWDIDAALSSGASVEYGLSDEGTGNVIDYGIRIDNHNNEIKPIVAGELETNTNSYNGDLENWNTYYQLWNSITIGSVSTMEKYSNSPDSNLNYKWRTDENLPFSTGGIAMDSAVVIIESESGGEEQVSLDKITYDTEPVDETDSGEVPGLGPGDSIDEIGEQDEIVDGGFIDNTLRRISDTLGIGLSPTRFLLGLIISLGVGVGIGFREEFRSTEIGAIGFGMTFVGLTFIGLIPIEYSIILIGVTAPLGWKIWKSTKGGNE